jgi:hypothetical protein
MSARYENAALPFAAGAVERRVLVGSLSGGWAGCFHFCYQIVSKLFPFHRLVSH